MTLDGVPGRGVSFPHLGAFLLLWALAQLVVTAVHFPFVFTGGQVDSDGYLRLVRVELLYETRAWFDGTIPRSNWPFGEDHHWTRPLDVLILLLALPFLPFMDAGRALAWAGSLVSPLLHLALCLSAVWVVRPVVPGPVRVLAMPAMLLQMGLLAYGTAGRADHHALIFLLFVLALGCWIRVLLAPHRGAEALGAGLLSALGIWVSPESLLPLALLFASGGVAWVQEGRAFARPNRLLGAGLLAGLVAAVLLEVHPSQWFVPAFDQVSVAHITMSLLALGFWMVAGGWEGERGHRVGIAALGGLAALALLRLVHPRFFQGPWVDVDREVIDVWLRYVSELQPLFPQQAADLGPFFMHLGAAFFLLPFLVLRLRADRGSRRGLVWILLLLSMAVYVPLAAYQIRFSGYAGAVFAVGMVVLLQGLLGDGRRREGTLQGRGYRVAGMAGVLLGPILVGMVTGGIAVAATATEGDGEAATPPGCSLPAMARVLAEPAAFGARPRTLVAFIDDGPELLYRTPHRVLAGPYHRNAQGILGAYHFLTATDEGEARALAHEHEVDLILLCPAVDRTYFDRVGEGALYPRLLEGRGPDWIRPVELPPHAPPGFILFQVIR